MRSIFYTLLFICIFTLNSLTHSFAQDEAEITEDPCISYTAYPAHYKKCLLRQKQLKRMKNAKDRRAISKTRRHDRLSQGITKKQQIQKEKAEALKKATEEKSKKETEDIKKTEEPEIDSENNEVKKKVINSDSTASNKLTIDPKKITSSQLQRIKQILAEKTEQKARKAPKMKTIKQPSIPRIPNTPITVTLPNIGLSEPQYIQLNPLTPSQLYQH